MKARRPSYFAGLVPRPVNQGVPLLQPPRLLFRPLAATAALPETPPPRPPAIAAPSMPGHRAAPTAALRSAEPPGTGARPPASAPTGTRPLSNAATPRDLRPEPALPARPGPAPRSALPPEPPALRARNVWRKLDEPSQGMASPGAADGGPVVHRARNIATPDDRAAATTAAPLPTERPSTGSAPPVPAHAGARQSRAPMPEASAPMAREPVTAPLPALPLRSAAAAPPPDVVSAGLRIGTLEVRVAAPPTPAPRAMPAPPRVPAPSGAPARIARPFAAFGLSQS